MRRRDVNIDQPPVRVLLVDDDPDDLALTRDYLMDAEGSRFELTWARSCTEGLSAIREGFFDVVLLDYHLGPETGLDFLARMPAENGTPVLLLTAQTEREIDLAAMHAGAADYLVKAEITPTVLERSIRYVVAERRAEEAKREAETRYRVLVESVGAIVWQADPETFAFSLVSAEAEVLFGFPLAQWTEQPSFWEDHIHPEDRSWVVDACRKAARREEPHSLEYRMIAADGRVVWVRDIVRVIRGRDGRQLAGVMVDISERKREENAVRESRALLRAVVDGIADPLFLKAADGRYRLMNSAGAHILGLEPQQVVGRTDRDIFPPDVAEQFRARDARIRRSMEAETHEETVYTPAEVQRTFLITASPHRDASGEIGVLGIARDITQIVQAQAELARSEAHYRRLVRTATHTVYAVDDAGRFIELNPAGERLIGRTADGLRGRHFAEVVAPESLPAAEEVFTRVLSGSVASVEIELSIVRSDGERRLLSISVTGIPEGESVVGLHGIARDITEERERERQIRLLAFILDQLSDQGVSVISPDEGIIYANAAHARILGYDSETRVDGVLGMFFQDDGARKQVNQILRVARENRSWSGQIQTKRPSDGAVLTLDAVVGRVEEQGRELFFTLVRDASDWIAREQQLRRAERLASVGTLLGGVAHELNNPLQAIRSFAELMLMEERGAEGRESLEIMKREADRAAKVVSNLRMIARRTQDESTHREAVDLNQIVRHVLRLRGYALKTANIEVREDLAPNLPPVWADGSQMEQVLLNLVVNSEQAMTTHRGGGRLIVRTRPSRAGVSLYIVDDGPGIAAEHLDRIFDPFWTTKSPGEGTGLGLSLVHSIITEHGGELRVESQVGVGAAFAIDLASAPSVATPPTEAAPPSVPERQLRILVVDDEHALRRSLERYLTRRGHAVDVASDGREALRILAAAGEAGYDAILSDLKMPGFGGERLLAELRAQQSGLDQRLVFLSGDAAGESATRLIANAGVPILLKPIDLEEVARALEQRADQQ